MGRHPDVTDVPEWRFTTDPDGIVDFYTQAVTGLQTPFHFDVRLKRLKALLADVARRGRADSVLGSAKFRRWAASTVGRNLSPAYARTDATSYSPNFERISRRLLEDLTSFSYPGYWVGMHAFGAATLAFSDHSREEIRQACARFLEGVAADVCTAQSAKAHLEKNTWNILCWDRTLEVLPNARLVHIVRDPRDVVSSYSDQSWVPTDPVRAARILASIMGRWREITALVPASSYHEVRLEDLTADPEGEFRKICDFWELEWSPTLLETTLSSASFGRWRTDLSADHAGAVTEIVTPVMQKYGYA
jgi:hypothetical protein